MVEMPTVLQALGKSKAYEVLKALSEGEKTQQDLSLEARTYLSTVQRALEAFEEIGFVESLETQSSTGRKITKYKLTPLGHAVLHKLEELENLLSQKEEPVRWVKEDVTID